MSDTMDEENHEFGLITRRRRSRLPRSSCDWGRSLTPRPSFALVKFWQGRVELLLRVLCLVFSSGSLTASVFCYLSLGFPTTGEDLVDSTGSEVGKVVMWAVCTSAVAVFLQLVVVACRFLNFHCASSHASLVHVLDVIASVMFTSAYFTLIIPLIVFCSDVALFTRILPKLDPIVQYHRLRGRCLATITLCLASMITFLVLSIWMSIYLSFNWDRKLDRLLQQQQRRRQQQQQQQPTGDTPSDHASPDAAGGDSSDSPRRGHPPRRQQSPPPSSSPPGQPSGGDRDSEESLSQSSDSDDEDEISDERRQVLRDYFSL